MVALSSNRIAWTYTANDGTEYRVAAQKALTDQGVLGGTAAASTVPAKPGYMKMRSMTFSDASGNSRVVPIYEVTATAKTQGTTLNVNVLGTSTPLVSSGVFIPQKPIRASATTKQST
jgi:hypothetical protein